MKNWLILLGLTLVLFSCETRSEEPSMNTIMPLGASRVQGAHLDTTATGINCGRNYATTIGT